MDNEKNLGYEIRKIRNLLELSVTQEELMALSDKVALKAELVKLN